MGKIEVRRIRMTIEDQIVALVCNQCGARHDVGDHEGEHANNIHLFRAGGGYATRYPTDMVNIEFALCSECLLALTQGFKLAPDMTESMGVPPYETLHTEHDLAIWVVDGGWAYPRGECPWEEYTHDTRNQFIKLAREREDLLQTLEENSPDWPSTILFRHFKSTGGTDHLYEVVDRHIYDASTHEPLIVYQALNGDSPIYIRPLRMWGEQIERDGYQGPRFQAVELLGG